VKPQEYNFIKYKLRQLMGVDLSGYKSPQTQRRLKTYLLRSGYPNWPSFFRAIQNDSVQLGKLKDYLTINVSSFFRDPEKFEYLRTAVLPDLLRQRPRLRVWSAGCSLGHEPYSLGMLLAEATGLYANHSILATDVDNSALAHARAGGPYGADKLSNVSPVLLKRYFRQKDETYTVIDGLRRKITFRNHNLLQEPFENDFDLIVCRNVVIYFSAEIKLRLYKQFHDALRPNGVLFVGSTEVLPHTTQFGYEPVGISFYRRKNQV
jgi:chemotaxis protein methyltransferase CheR